ncbi:MAG: hypothetical protein LBE18_07465 [Planctomycetaceae bacterium]|jgi:hypothetical protein|nr:hypothetical protein [Planctomycetaceae bacterium]
MIILYPGYSLQSLADLSETESDEILSAFTALFHPAVFSHFGKIPQLESVSNISPSSASNLIIVPPCCELHLPQEFENFDFDNNVTIIRNIHSRNSIVNEIIKRFNIQHNFCKKYIDDFYTLGTTVLFVSLLANHLHYIDNSHDNSILQALNDIIDNINSKNNITNSSLSSIAAMTDDLNIIETKNQSSVLSQTSDINYSSSSDAVQSDAVEIDTHNLFRTAFERICEMKEFYYSVNSYLLDLTLVVKTTLGEPFRQLLKDRNNVNLILPSLLLDLLPEIDSESFAELKSAVSAGKVNFVADDVSESPLLLQPLLDAADKILQGISIYRDLFGVIPTIYGRQKVGLTPFLPQILKLSGFKSVLFFAALDGWHLKQRNQSKMIWKGIDGTNIDALIRYPKSCTTNKDLFDFADHYSDLLNSDSVPTAVFASFPLDKTQNNKKENNGKINTNNSCTDISCNENSFNNNSESDNSDNNDIPNWYKDLQRMSSYTSQLGESIGLESYFATTERTGSEEFISAENFLNVEPSDIPYWIKLYRENLTRVIKSALSTVSQLLIDPKSAARPSDKSQTEIDSGTISEYVREFASAVGLRCIVDKNDKTNNNENSASCEIKSEQDLPEQDLHRGIAIFNVWNFGRRVFIDVSDWSKLPSAVSPIIFAGEKLGKKEIVVDIPPLGYTFIPVPEKITTENPSTSDEVDKKKIVIQAEGSSVGGLSILTQFFKKRAEPSLVTRSDNGAAFFLQNEFFVAKIDSDTGMLRSLFTSNYRYNRLSQQLGFRLPKAIRDIDSRPAKDPNRGYANSAADEIEINELGSVTGSIRIKGRLICDDGRDAAIFSELVTIHRYSRILEFHITLEPILEPSGDSAWDSYYAIRSAWNDRSFELRGSLGDGLYSVTTNRVLSPRFIDLRNEKRSITFFSEGLPFHRRFADRYLDTILIAKGDNKYDAEGNKIDNNNIDSCIDSCDGSNRVTRNFRFGVGIDIRHPSASSFEFMLMKNEMAIPVCHAENKVFSRWLFRLDSANIIALHWEPFYNDTNIKNSKENIPPDNIVEKCSENYSNKDELIGFKIYLLETEGTQTSSVLRSFKPITNSYATNLLGEVLQQLNINEAGVQITMHPHELLPLVCIF